MDAVSSDAFATITIEVGRPTPSDKAAAVPIVTVQYNDYTFSKAYYPKQELPIP
jgi:hypothetical protein